MTGLSFGVVHQMSDEEREQTQAYLAESDRLIAEKSKRSQAKRAARDRRYNTSERGRARHRRYNRSERGQARSELYDSSPRGQAVRASYELYERYLVNSRAQSCGSARDGRCAECPGTTWFYAESSRLKNER
jgi:hypothetical protein